MGLAIAVQKREGGREAATNASSVALQMGLGRIPSRSLFDPISPVAFSKRSNSRDCCRQPHVGCIRLFSYSSVYLGCGRNYIKGSLLEEVKRFAISVPQGYYKFLLLGLFILSSKDGGISR